MAAARAPRRSRSSRTLPASTAPPQPGGHRLHAGRGSRRDLHVVRMAFRQTRGRDAGEARPLVQLLDGSGTGVAHAGPEAAHQLEDHVAQRALVRHHALDAFRDQLLLIGSWK